MGARYDKYDPIAGGFRAPLAADLTPDANGEFGPVGVKLNANGRVVVGGLATDSGIVGVVIKNVPLMPAGLASAAQALTGIWQGVKAGDIVDIMTNGEIVDFNPAIPAGSKVYANATTGLLTATATANYQVGFVVEVGRLVVRVVPNRAAG